MNDGKKKRTRSRGERGQSLVETALVVPVLVTLLVGAVEMARVIYGSIAVANAAKAGAQYGSQGGFTSQDTSGIAAAASYEAPNLTVSTSSSTSCACSDGTASTCLNTDCPNSHIEETLTVNTSATVSATVRLPGLPTSYTVKGQSIQRVVQ